MAGERPEDGRSAGDAVDAATLTYRIDDAERPGNAVVRAVAAFTDTSPLDLDPLGRVIDFRSLDGLLDGSTAAPSVSFRYGGCHVTITPDSVRVRGRADDDG